MFTGIIEQLGVIKNIEVEQDNLHLDIEVEQDLLSTLKVDQSIAHNGICLTVVSIDNSSYRVTAVAETLQKTNLKNWKQGDKVNIERAMPMHARLDGHVVQGHVDGVGKCIAREDNNGSLLFTFEYPNQFAALLIEKGSICINGVSLTAFNLQENTFQVTIIPYTLAHTTFQFLQPEHSINLEFDVLGKYLQRHIDLAQLKM